jgi:hypothetical protein
VRLLAGSLADDLEELARLELELAESLPSFREFLESPAYAAPYMAAVGISPFVAAIVDASEGSPVETLDDATCREVFRLVPRELPLGEVPRIVVVNAGRQSGKTSNLLAPKAVHAAWTQRAPHLRPGQVARVVIISPHTDQSKAAFRYCKGIVESSPRLRRNLVKITTEQILLRRPDGHLVEIVTGAADAGGSAARSSTLLFAGLDEVAFFFDDSHAVNDRAIFDAAMGTLRMLPGAQLWMVSTPWIEGSGLMEEFIAEHWGRRSSVLVAARISSYALRGAADDASLREETDTEETYRREVLAQPMPAGAGGFFSATELSLAVTRKPPEGEPLELGAGGDFAFERDALAAVVVGRWIGGYFAPVLVEERRATPGDIEAATLRVRELGAAVAEAGCQQIMGDHWKRTFVREHLHLEGVAFVDAPGSDEGKAETYGAWKRVIAEGRLCLGLLPRRVAEYVRDQLRAVIATPMPGPGGRFRISIPRTKRLLEGQGAGRIGAHGDVASALVLAGWQAGAGRQAASWERPVHQGAARTAKQVSARARVGAGGSMDYLRSRSTFGRPALGDE